MSDHAQARVQTRQGERATPGARALVTAIGLALALAVPAGTVLLSGTPAHAQQDPRFAGVRCTRESEAAGARWKGTYSGTAPSGIFPRAWSGSRCFRTEAACQAWLNTMAGLYSYSTRYSFCRRA